MKAVHAKLAPRAARRGQTLILALAILFLLVLLGGIFITIVAKNLRRVSRQGTTDDALTLALAGIQHAAQSLHSAPEGVDWRPQPTELLWQGPNLTDLDGDGNTTNEQQWRQLDPDASWLSDDGKLGNPGEFAQPFVRYATGKGRFLLRVTYLPSYRAAGPASVNADDFDPNSGTIHIESIGRPGDFNPGDPTSFVQDPTTVAQPGQIKGQFRKIEAFVPVGLVDQLWWITNATHERGPATLGVPPHKNPGFDPEFPNQTDAGGNPVNREFVSFPTLFDGGGIRSEVDLQFNGRVAVRLYPSRDEFVSAKGNISFGSQANATWNPASPVSTSNHPPLEIQIVDDNGGALNQLQPNPPTYTVPGDQQLDGPPNGVSVPVTVGSNDPNFEQNDPIAVNAGGDQRLLLQDEKHLRNEAASSARTARNLGAPPLNQIDPATGVNRYLLLTRDSGKPLDVTDGNGQLHRVNSGAYGLTDSVAAVRDPGGTIVSPAVPASVRAQGLYLDNFGDIQHKEDRKLIVDEWMRRGSPNRWLPHWTGDYYIPNTDEAAVNHPVADVLLTQAPDSNGNLRPVIRITRYDLNPRQMNLAPADTRPSGPRQFYNLSAITAGPKGGTAGTLTPMGYTRDFDYPENGVFFAEGSVRVRGVVGMPGVPKQLTIVSGGTIYIDGNIIKGDGTRASFLALLAQDYVTLNPTAFVRLRPGENVGPPVPDSLDPNTSLPTGFHWAVEQGSDFDFSFSSAAPISQALLFVKHTAVHQDASSETAVNLALPNPGAAAWPDMTPGSADRYDFGTNVPPGGAFAPNPQHFYLFHEIPPSQPVGWAESRVQADPSTNQVGFERKAFFIPALNGGATPGQELTFRFIVGPKEDGSMSPNGQPWWFSKVAVVPDAANAADRKPLQIQVDAVIYAYTGSWFVIPPPAFNEESKDSRAQFAATAKRFDNTFPDNLGAYPFYNEALNIDVQLHGAVSEDMPALPSEQAAWASRMWVDDSNYDPASMPGGAPPAAPPFRPWLSYHYDANLKRMVRVRILRTGEEYIAWTAPGTAPGDAAGLADGVGTLAEIQQRALNENSFIVTLPVVPKLPVSSVLYEGSPL